MVPIAIGTQTLGSVLRPASYCGITGFKPSFGRLTMEGVLPMARSLDTLGLFTNTPAGMLQLWEALGESVGEREDLVLGVPEPPSSWSRQWPMHFRRPYRSCAAAGLPSNPFHRAPARQAGRRSANRPLL